VYNSSDIPTETKTAVTAAAFNEDYLSYQHFNSDANSSSHFTETLM
jgi:hypothetical protein